jgi:hypothetical protein
MHDNHIIDVKIANEYFKMWQMWGVSARNKNYVHEEVRAEYILGMLATFQFRVLCFHVSCLKA